MKKLLSALMALVLTCGMSVSAFAATEELGSTDFDTRVGYNGSRVSKTVRSRNGTFKVNGIYYSAPGKEVLKLINEEREDHDLKKLVWVPELLQPAIQRALEQYLSDWPTPLSHTRPNGSKFDTVSSFAYGENLALGDTSADDVMTGWMNSPDHKYNILDEDFTGVAVACVETDKAVYWVQLFNIDKKSSTTSSSTRDDDDNTTETTKTTTTTTTKTTTATTAPASTEVTSKSVTAALTKAKTTAAITPVTLKNVAKLPLDAIKGAASWGTSNKKTVSVTATTLTATGKSTQGRITLNPASFTKNKNAIKTGVRIDSDSVSGALKDFNARYPGTKAAMIKCDQSGSYGGAVMIGAKVNLTGLDSKKLSFYNFDTKTGKLTKIDLSKSPYSIDKNKYLNFQTSRGGYIVVTDKAVK